MHVITARRQQVDLHNCVVMNTAMARISMTLIVIVIVIKSCACIIKGEVRQTIMGFYQCVANTLMIGIDYLKPNKVQTMFWFSSNDTKAILQGEKSLEEEDCGFVDSNALNHIL